MVEMEHGRLQHEKFVFDASNNLQILPKIRINLKKAIISCENIVASTPMV